VIVPQKGKNKKDIIGKQPSFKYGIAYGVHDIPHANDTQHLVKSHLNQLEQAQILETSNMFKKINTYFNL
jgi:hypothetical protein